VRRGSTAPTSSATDSSAGASPGSYTQHTLCATILRTPAPRAASTRWRVPSVRSAALAAESPALRS
jgi:hypothetical protein